ncbi:MAG TPA: hypothetical protein VFV99_01530 [Kofleriaceae bacterium]|nr:hypothetical protein [Kofleriaceae bacterium]
MLKLILVPALLLAACGDNLHPDEDQVATGAAGSGSDAPGDTPDAAVLTARFIPFADDCDNHGVRFEAQFGYSDGGAVANPICHYDFADGTSADTCVASHSLPTAQIVRLTVTDPATGAMAVAEDSVIGPEIFDVIVDLSSGLSSSGRPFIAWSARTLYGGAEAGKIQFVDFDPIQDVEILDPEQQIQPTGVVSVNRPGVYTVSVLGSVELDLGGCSKIVSKTIDLTTCITGTH